MDSLTQLALGAAVAVAALGSRARPWKAALVGAICGTLPDLDVFLDHGDAVRNLTYHRAESHSLFFLTLAAPLFAWLFTKLFKETRNNKRWLLAVWLALITHPLLDLMTVFGTQLLRPFTDTPFAVGSIFIIDPLYTVPLLIGVGGTLCFRNIHGLRWNKAGLILSSLYLIWSACALTYVTHKAENSLAAAGITPEKILVTPTPFNTMLWRVLAVTPTDYVEGFYAIADGGRPISFDRFPRNAHLFGLTDQNWAAERMIWFSRGFYKMTENENRLTITDLRMGQEPYYIFTYSIAARDNGGYTPQTPEQIGDRPAFRRSFSWLWQRALGTPLPPPR